MNYGLKLKLARKWAGITQKELAKRAGIATITVQQYESEKRKPSIENWYSIANALHLSLDELNNAETLPQGEFNPDTIPEEMEMEDAKDRRALKHMILDYFAKLNERGQQEAVKRVEELTEIPRYQKEKSPAEGD